MGNVCHNTLKIINKITKKEKDVAHVDKSLKNKTGKKYIFLLSTYKNIITQEYIIYFYFIVLSCTAVEF